MIKLQNEALSSLLYLSVLDTNQLVLSPLLKMSPTQIAATSTVRHYISLQPLTH